jgi:competence protein ComEC
MKIPAVAIAAVFVGGILLGLLPAVARHATSHAFLALAACCCFGGLVAGLFLVSLNYLRLAATTSLGSWVALGIFASCIAQQRLPPEHVLRRIEAKQIDLKSPLRWHGRVTDEPSRLPWGYSIEVELRGVDSAGSLVPLRGGMRVGFTPNGAEGPLPDVHAGDEVTVVTEARLPPIFRDPGAFNRREFLARQNIDVVATLRSSRLLEIVSSPKPTLAIRLARVRGRLRRQVDELFPRSPQTAGVLRAMLLGDRSFIDRTESVDFQKTGVFHVLVVAGLHVGALAIFLNWLFRRLRLPRVLASILLLTLLVGYVAVVEQRPPVLRAGLMVAIVVLARLFYRHLDLLNSANIAALLLLVAQPMLILDSSFQLSFLAIGCIAGSAAPWMMRHTQPWARALAGWGDHSKDSSHEPRCVQFRLDLRSITSYLTSSIAGKPAKWIQNRLINCVGLSLLFVNMLVLSFALQLGMLPLMARDFHRISLLGLAANFFVAPLTGIIVPFGFFDLGSSFIIPWMGRLCGLPLAWLVTFQSQIVSEMARFPLSSYRIPGPPNWTLYLFFVAAMLLATGQRNQTRFRRWLTWSGSAGLVTGAILVAWYPFTPSTAAKTLEITVLDVGQGDSILVVSPLGSTLLIDGGGAFQGFRGHEDHPGPDPGEDAVSPYLWSRGFKKLNAVAVTHAHQDHIGGLTAILQNFKVERVWLGNENASPALAHFESLAAQLHVPVEHEVRGQSFLWDGVQVDFLWPEPESDATATSAKNNDSLVVRLRYGDRTILLPGDAEKQAERSMLSENDANELRADVLKIGHHGSKNSSMPEFLAAVAPQIAIISAGEANPYGHPSPQLLRRLGERGIRILRTDQDGAVQVRTDGHDLSVTCFVACPMGASKPGGSAQVPNNQQSGE